MLHERMTKFTTYRKRPIEVQAVQLLRGNAKIVAEFVGRDGQIMCSGDGATHGMIRTNHGMTHVRIGDWIIKGVDGEIYPCSPRVFDATYEPVDGEDDVLAELARE